ncbi:MAG TPA: hypothetical protein VK927_10890 [Adhaeribacter sp.]|nr:hypothetical protein [Adhaeribacter sp.]
MKNSFDLIRKAFAVLLISGLSLGAYAQGQGPGDGGPTPTDPPPDPAEIPIDGGASLLVAGGVAYGIKKLRDHRRKSR